MALWRNLRSTLRRGDCTRRQRRESFDLETAPEALDRRIQELEESEREALRTVKARTEDVRTLEAEVIELKKKAHHIEGEHKKERAVAESRARDLEEEVAKSREVVARLEREAGEASERATRSTTEARGWEEERTSLARQLELAQKGLAEKERAISQQSDLLQRRAAELNAALAHVPREDSVSCADVVGMVMALNGKVFQLSAIISDTCVRVEEEVSDRLEAAAAAVSGQLGVTMAELLKAVSAGVCEELVIQLSIQAYLSQFTCYIVNSWVPTTKSPAINCFMEQVYDEMHLCESQSISAKWRTLARSYGRKTEPISDILQAEKEDAIHVIASILALAGMCIDLAGDLLAKLDSKITDILASCMQLRDTIGEGVVTRDFRVVGGGYGAHFVSDTMEDAFGSEHLEPEVNSEPRVVLCATELGLETSTSRSGASKDEMGVVERTLALKPKVVTTAALDGLLGSSSE